MLREKHMKTTRFLFLSLLLVQACILFCAQVQEVQANSAITCNWHVVSSPNPTGQKYNTLVGVAALSTNNIWAVGASYQQGSPVQAIIEHWNGTSWRLVSSNQP